MQDNYTQVVISPVYGGFSAYWDSSTNNSYISISGGFSTVHTQNPNSLYCFPSYGGLSAMIIIDGLKSSFSPVKEVLQADRITFLGLSIFSELSEVFFILPLYKSVYLEI